MSSNISNTSEEDIDTIHIASHNNISRSSLSSYGHVNWDFNNFINNFKSTYPKIMKPLCLEIEFGGYYYSKEHTIPDNIPNLAWSIDELGRTLFFIDDEFIFQRYAEGDTLVYYKRDNITCEKNTTATYDDLARWLKICQ